LEDFEDELNTLNVPFKDGTVFKSFLHLPNYNIQCYQKLICAQQCNCKRPAFVDPLYAYSPIRTLYFEIPSNLAQQYNQSCTVPIRTKLKAYVTSTLLSYYRSGGEKSGDKTLNVIKPINGVVIPPSEGLALVAVWYQEFLSTEGTFDEFFDTLIRLCQEGLDGKQPSEVL